MASHLQSSHSCGYYISLYTLNPNPLTIQRLPSLIPSPISKTPKPKFRKLLKIRLLANSVSPLQSSVNDATLPALPPENKTLIQNNSGKFCNKVSRKARVFLLDVNPLCYDGNRLSLLSFARWVSIFFSQVSFNDPVIAVLDGEGGNEHRRELMPSYKANRRKFRRPFPDVDGSRLVYSVRSRQVVTKVLQECNVPVIKIEEHEADDVIATLVDQVIQKGFRAVIASPDKDFKQLISEDVQIVLPVPELERWSFYTLKHYVAQHNCDPQSDLSLRCILGDETDGVPGIQHFAPGFGRKTALKLLKKHGSLENLLAAVKVRSVGRNYAQEALTKYGDFLQLNYKVLSLKRDIDVQIDDHWLKSRDDGNDSATLSSLMIRLRRPHESGSR